MTDDLSTYKPVVDGPGLEHQICFVYVRKNVARRLRKAKGWDEWKSRLRNLLDELPDDEGKRLMDMEREVREEPALRRLAVTDTAGLGRVRHGRVVGRVAVG